MDTSADAQAFKRAEARSETVGNADVEGGSDRLATTPSLKALARGASHPPALLLNVRAPGHPPGCRASPETRTTGGPLPAVS
jgi:hypothetical protein